MRYIWDKKDRLFRVFRDWTEIAYIKFGLTGPQAEIEFPSDWHEVPRAWVRFGVGFCRFAFSFPWHKIVPDECQCSGPTYGFYFFEDYLVFSWGKAKGKNSDPRKHFRMPWGWRFVEHKKHTEPETHPYRYIMNDGEVQEREATIYKESREWWRPWLPCKLYRESINIDFSDEVGERTGSWKGGVVGCGYDMKDGETPLDTLRRMERERVFN
ncbi:MAG: hypothetical protein AB7E51_06610 [Pseudodesulfovibrio sp.]|uniref:hypothetical protein n=1 Tax=Pseudodesulfovibrio sp. TaxID=2035812 RepID=UPI003D11B170